MEVSLLTPKCTLVPEDFFRPEACREILSEVFSLEAGDEIGYKAVPHYGAVMVYAASPDCEASVDENIISDEEVPLPEMYFILRDLHKCPEYNKILFSWQQGVLYLAIAQGRTLLLSNTYRAADAVTAQYFIHLAMKSLQLNPEVSTIVCRKPVDRQFEMDLYRYFKSVDTSGVTNNASTADL